MSVIEQAVEVDVPVRTAYDQWTQFEDFPHFMEGVESVAQITDTKLHWRTKVGPVVREFDADITEQTPDQRIAWCSTSGPTHSGVVTFHRIADARSRIMLQLEIDPDGFVEQAGDKLGLLKRRTKGDMERFKEFIESRGSETGGWRGEVKQDKT
ncbi:MAG TPA: SRPBCC family protein [Acidimicrobiales bacterium]|nr:SRPBCC family protein [Acidimicrobiales bacterium]